jgi:hypothetical protein
MTAQPQIKHAVPDEDEFGPVSPPDLQALVREFGTYSEITPEAWRRWDEENRRYQIARRLRIGGAL